MGRLIGCLAAGLGCLLFLSLFGLLGPFAACALLVEHAGTLRTVFNVAIIGIIIAVVIPIVLALSRDSKDEAEDSTDDSKTPPDGSTPEADR